MISKCIKHNLTVLLISLVLSFVPCISASGNWGVLVVPEFDSESLDANHRAYLTAGEKIRDQLTSEFNLDVYLGQSRDITLRCQSQCDDGSRYDLIQQLYEMNKKTDRPPIDLIVFYHIMSTETQLTFGFKKLIKVSSLAIDIETGKTLAYDDGDQQLAEMANPSDDLINWEIALANRHARDSAAYIGERLEVYDRQLNYQLNMIDFAPKDLSRFEAHLSGLDSTQQSHIKLKESNLEKKQLLHQLTTNSYQLKSSIGSRKLNNSLVNYFENEGLSVTIFYGGITDGVRKFDVYHIGIAHFYKYLLALILILLFLLISIVIVSHRKHQRKLLKYDQDKKIISGLKYLKSRRLAILFTSKQDKERYKTWTIDEQQAYTNLKNAEQCITQHHYQKACELAEQAINLNSELQDAFTLLNKIPSYRKGYEAFLEGKDKLITNPVEAAKQLSIAKNLNPYLADEATTLLLSAETNFRQNTLATCFSLADKYIKAKDAYSALSQIDAALILITNVEDNFMEELHRLRLMRVKTLELIKKISDSFEIEGDLSGLIILSKKEIFIGRSSSSSLAEIDINFKRLSRPSKQIRLENQHSHFVMTDLGSTHGTAIDGEFIKSDETLPLMKRSIVAIGGDKTKSSCGACRLIMQPIFTSLYVELDQQSIALFDRSKLMLVWPSLENDLQKKWLCLNSDVPVGEFEGKLNVGCLGEAEPLFYFTKANEGYLGIRTNYGKDKPSLLINGIDVTGNVPLQKGVVISIKHYRFMII